MSVGREAIAATRAFFRQMKLPSTLREVGIDDSHFDIMAQKAAAGCKGSFVPLSADDIKAIFTAAL